MENDLWSDEPKMNYIPNGFKSPGFLFDVKEAEGIVNRSSISHSQIRATSSYLEEALNGYVDSEYFDSRVDVTGRAYFANNRGNIIYDSDGKPKNDIISASNLNFVGTELVYLEYESDSPSYKALCRFNSANNDSLPETLYFAPEDLILFTPTTGASGEINTTATMTADEENLLIKSVFKELADSTRRILTSPDFSLARSDEQKRILRLCAQQTADIVKLEYGKQTIEIMASEFLIVTESGIMHVDQKSKPQEDWNLPMGQFDDCTFYELINQPPNTKIGAIFRYQPLIVLLSYETGSQYLVPLLAFESANLIEE